MSTLKVVTFGETSKANAEKDLRAQLKIEADSRGVKLVGSPTLTTDEPIKDWWNGEATQECEE